MQMVIEIYEEDFEEICMQARMVEDTGTLFGRIRKAIFHSTPLPKGHGRLIDISKIDEDRIESNNPIIYLTINGEYTEAISLDYINNLPTIIEADRSEGE